MPITLIICHPELKEIGWLRFEETVERENYVSSDGILVIELGNRAFTLDPRVMIVTNVDELQYDPHDQPKMPKWVLDWLAEHPEWTFDAAVRKSLDAIMAGASYDFFTRVWRAQYISGPFWGRLSLN